MQVAHLLLDRVEVDFRQSPVGTAGHLAVWDLQIDNQLLTTAHPVVLASASRMAQQVRICLRSLLHMSSVLQMGNVMSISVLIHFTLCRQMKMALIFSLLDSHFSKPDGRRCSTILPSCTSRRPTCSFR